MLFDAGSKHVYDGFIKTLQRVFLLSEASSACFPSQIFYQHSKYTLSLSGYSDVICNLLEPTLRLSGWGEKKQVDRTGTRESQSKLLDLS